MCSDELAECIPSNERAEDKLELDELSKCIDEFLDTLDTTDRLLFVRRYWYFDEFQTLAELSGLRTGTVRTRLSRLRDMLKTFLESRGFDV